jgi:hypothetical protein
VTKCGTVSAIGMDVKTLSLLTDYATALSAAAGMISMLLPGDMALLGFGLGMVSTVVFGLISNALATR